MTWTRAMRSFEACRLRFRPIMMTTCAAMLGALPLALSFGDGGELRRPLGISIVGGLVVSQVLTLYTTPVLYLYLDRFRLAARQRWQRAFPASPSRSSMMRRSKGRGPGGLGREADRGKAPAGSGASPGSAAMLVLFVAGCMVGPDYKRPTPRRRLRSRNYKAGSPASRRTTADKGAWWSVYHDPELDRLERMVEVSNQTVKEFEAQYRNAVALVAEARASLFPTVGLTAGVTRAGGGGSVRGSSGLTSLQSSGSSKAGTEYSVNGSVSWDLDVWGKVRRQVESNVAGAQVSAADLANAKLSAQATLATDYFDLRAEDALAQLLRETVGCLPACAADHAKTSTMPASRRAPMW